MSPDANHGRIGDFLAGDVRTVARPRHYGPNAASVGLTAPEAPRWAYGMRSARKVFGGPSVLSLVFGAFLVLIAVGVAFWQAGVASERALTSFVAVNLPGSCPSGEWGALASSWIVSRGLAHGTLQVPDSSFIDENERAKGGASFLQSRTHRLRVD